MAWKSYIYKSLSFSGLLPKEGDDDAQDPSLTRSQSARTAKDISRNLSLPRASRASKTASSSGAAAAMSSSVVRERLYKRGSFLAVLSEDSSTYWLCRCSQHVFSDLDRFRIRWLEDAIDEDETMRLAGDEHYLEPQCVIRKVKVKQLKDKVSYVLAQGEREKVEREMGMEEEEEVEGDEEEEEEYLPDKERKEKEKEEAKPLVFNQNVYLAVNGEDGKVWYCKTVEAVRKGARTVKVRWLEPWEDEEEGVYRINRIEQVDKVGLGSVICKVKAKKVQLRKYEVDKEERERAEEELKKQQEEEESEEEEEEEEQEEEGKEKKVGEKRKRKPKAKKVKKPRLATGKKATTKRVPKAKKVPRFKKGEKRPPNWKLHPNPDLKVWDKDPLFASREEVPYVSSVVHSKLLFRAVELDDMDMLRGLIRDRKRLNSLRPTKSMSDKSGPGDLALKRQNLEALKILSKAVKDHTYGFAAAPTCMLAHQGTGTYNYRSLGIQRIRKLNMSRGGREGNNALLKDQDNRYSDCLSSSELARQAMTLGLPLSFMKELSTQNLTSNFSSYCSEAIRNGHYEQAAHYLKAYIDRNGYGEMGFSKFHFEAMGEDGWKDAPRETSIMKKSDHKGITPLHCACVNPSTKALKQMYAVVVNTNVEDSDKRALVHYAAACKSVEPLKYLASVGAHLDCQDNEGVTPLMVACELGRVDNAEFIIEKLDEVNRGLLDKEGLEESYKKIGKAGIDRQAKTSWTALFYAVSNGHLDVVKLLVEHGVKAEKQLNVTYGKITPLMLAAANGDLAMVRFLFVHARAEKADKFKRTALTHAAMNGSADVASFLLAEGVDPNKADSSGNTNLHYACAYGWFFCVEALLAAGAEVNAANEWKLMPVGIALLKGHMGIAHHLLRLPGVDINFRMEDGKTILLHMVHSAVSNDSRYSSQDEGQFSEALFEEVKELVEERGADATAIDNDGNNIIHYLTEIVPNRYKNNSFHDDRLDVGEFRAYLTRRTKLRDKFVSFFLNKKCSVLVVNERGQSALDRALSVYAETSSKHKRDYDLINTILDAMNEALERGDEVDWRGKDAKKSLGTLEDLCSSLSFAYIEQEFKLFKTLSRMMRRLGCDYVDVDDGQMPLLFKLCRKYAGCSRNFISQYQVSVEGNVLYPEVDLDSFGCLNDAGPNWDTFQDFIMSFISEYKPRLTYLTNCGSSDNPAWSTHSTLEILVQIDDSTETPTHGVSLFDKMRTLDSDVDVKDHLGRTLLNQFVMNQGYRHRWVVERLIKAGAEVDNLYQGDHRIRVSDTESIPVLTTSLSHTVRHNDVSYARFLLDAGASVKLNHVADSFGNFYETHLLLTAVNNCARARAETELAMVELLLAKGIDVNVTDDKRRNALHLAVNLSSSDADLNLDLEMRLLRKGCDVNAKDVRGRNPLHYAFVKIGKHQVTFAMDPIEVCGMLVEAMEGNGVDDPDEFGSTPLHYAAQRGATVCALHLLKNGASVNTKDKKGNTPICYAVMHKHEACTLTLLQKGADTNIIVDPKEEKVVKHDNKVRFKINPGDFPREEVLKDSNFLESIIANDWLGITYLTIQEMESFGMTYATAVETAMDMGKLQFAKTLISKQVSFAKLRTKVSEGRNLVSALAKAVRGGTSRLNLVRDNLRLLEEAGLPFDLKDDVGNTAVWYASFYRNPQVLGQLFNYESTKACVNYSNEYGVTPIAAAMWHMNSSENSGVRSTLKTLMEEGASPNVLVSLRPLDHLRAGYTADTVLKEEYEYLGCKKITPLIAAIVHKDRKIMRWLLTNSFCKADVNQADSEGMTPLMHAVRTNDPRIVYGLFSPESLKDFTGYKLLINLDIKVNQTDDHGFTALHHLIELDPTEGEGFKGTFDNEEILDLLLKRGANTLFKVDMPGKGSMTVLERAKAAGAFKIVKRLAAKEKVREVIEHPEVEVEAELELVDLDDDLAIDIEADARAMLEKMEKEETKKEKEGEKAKKEKEGGKAKKGITNGHVRMKIKKMRRVIESDSEDTSDEEYVPGEDVEDDDMSISSEDEDDEENDVDDFVEAMKDVNGLKRHHGCTVRNGTLHNGYALLMTKIDVSFGAWGLYNYYRMEIWKKPDTDLWVLFTNWGRIGDQEGQYQNTPFGTAQQAEEAFEKIFKSKAGNEWADRAAFEPKPKKYRLVKTEHLSRVPKSQLALDLDKAPVKSRLPKTIRKFIEGLADVSVYVEAYKQLGGDSATVPFGRIKEEDVKAARDILDQLEPLAVEVEENEAARRENPTEELHEKHHELLSRVCELSSEYYYLMPKSSYTFTTLPPLDSKDKVKQELTRVEGILELTEPENLLLAANYNRKRIHPLDYIYRALGCRFRVLEPEAQEVPYLLRYINNTGGRSASVRNIFKVSCKATEANFGSSISWGKTYNRMLLWHGTKASNLLSILKQGLLINPRAPITGKAFGNGIYFSDCFSKSYGYTGDYRYSSRGSFILLNDVALGKVRKVGITNTPYYSAQDYPGGDNDTVRAIGQNVPDPSADVRFAGGITLPSGTLISNPQLESKVNRWSYVQHNEYVTFDESQSTVRYIIQMD